MLGNDYEQVFPGKPDKGVGEGDYEVKVGGQAWRITWLGPPGDSECHTS